MPGTVWDRNAHKKGKKPDWAFGFERGYDAEGKRKRCVMSGFATKREAEAAMIRAMAEIDKNNPLAANKPKHVSVLKPKRNQQTVAGYLAEWLPTRDVYDTTMSDYKYLIGHIVSHIGSVILVNLTSDCIEAMYKTIKVEGFSLSRRKKIDWILRCALEEAVEKKLLISNPCHKRLSPKKQDKQKVRKAFGIDEITDLDRQLQAFEEQEDLEPFRAMDDLELGKFLAVITGTRFYVAHLLTVRRGLRRGEVLGLRWRDIDFQRRTIIIRQSLVICNGKREFHPPKNGRPRTIHLSIELIKALKEYLTKQKEEIMKRRDTYKDYGMVFPTQDGRPFDPNNFVKRHFKPLLTKAGLPDFRYHDLRHTAATMMLKDGVDIQIVSKVLGHSSEAFTYRVYGHLLPGMQEMALDRFDGGGK